MWCFYWLIDKTALAYGGQNIGRWEIQAKTREKKMELREMSAAVGKQDER